MRPPRAPWAVAAALALAGCGGGSEEGRPGLGALGAEQGRLLAATGGMEATGPADLPMEGRGEYAGVMAVATAGAAEEPGSMLGELALTVDWGDDALSGAAGNFVSASGEEMEGELRIGEGRLRRDAEPPLGDLAWGATVEGRLEAPDGTASEWTGLAQGGFLGEGAEALSGAGEGVVESGSAAGVWTGTLVAER